MYTCLRTVQYVHSVIKAGHYVILSCRCFDENELRENSQRYTENVRCEHD